MTVYNIPRRSFMLHLFKNCPEATTELDAWREGEVTFEQAMMMAAHRLFMANEELQRRLDYATLPQAEPSSVPLVARNKQFDALR